MDVLPSTIAVVDDEPHIRETVGFALTREGHRVTSYPDGAALWRELDAPDHLPGSEPDVVVLDVLMPRMDGLELCRRLRGRFEALPIVFLSSKDDEFDRILGLELGADDYLCKPFSMRELVTRVKVLLRRLALFRAGPATEVRSLRCGALHLDLDRYEASLCGDDPPTPLALTVTEFLLLRALVERPGHVKSRGQLMRQAYPDDAFVSERTIDTHVKRIRAKLRAAGEQAPGLETVHGLGYRFREPEVGS